MRKHFVATVKLVEVTVEDVKPASRTGYDVAAKLEPGRTVDELTNFMVKDSDLKGLTAKVQEMLKVVGGNSE